MYHTVEAIPEQELVQARSLCSQCGVIEPEVEQFECNGETWYSLVRGECRCEQAAREEQRLQEERRERLRLAYETFRWTESDCAYLHLVVSEPLFPPLALKRFHDFEQKSQPEAFDAAYAFAERPVGTLILHGGFGTGKTHLAAAICNELREERQQRSCFCTAPELFLALARCMRKGEDETELLYHARTAPVLVLDDVDKAKHSEYREQVYFDILNPRTDAGLPTVITTNKLEELERYVGGAVYSRLCLQQIAVEMIGNDYRKTVLG